MSRRIAVVFGGPSAEAEVSRVSGAAVQRALLDSGYDVVGLELDAALPARVRDEGVLAVVPTTHGPLGEDGCLQGLLEVLGVPYSGSGVLASAIAANKAVARQLFLQAGLPVARGVQVDRSRLTSGVAQRLRKELGQALVVKPVSGGSAIGVGRVRADEPLEAVDNALLQAFEIDSSVVVESFRTGDEVTCGVLEDESGVPLALPPTRIIAKASDWYDFTSRYGTGGSEHQCPAPFEPELIRRIQEVAVLAHQAVTARDLSRVDFIVSPESGEVTLLEVNTLPGMTPTSLFPEAAMVAGLGFGTLCARLADKALARAPRHAPGARPMPA